MPQHIEVPGMGVVEFPDGMTDDQITKAIKANMPAGGDGIPKMLPRQRATSLAGIAPQTADPGDLLAGAVRGVAGIGNTLTTMPGGGYFNRLSDKNKNIDNILGSMGADTSSASYGGSKILSELAGTAGVGNVLAKGAQYVPYLRDVPGLLESIKTFGMRTGNQPVGVVQQAGNMAVRSVGGAVAGGGATAMVDPQSVGTGAVVGAVTPPVVALAGAAGRGMGSIKRAATATEGSQLAAALGISEAEAQQLAASLKAAPSEFVPGSRLTVAQALQSQGVNQPGVKMLERVVAGGAGGDPLLKRYADQAAARLASLEANGAQTYQGAGRMEAEQQGSKIGAVLRTQAGDASEANRKAWESLYQQGSRDGVQVMLPLQEMKQAMGPLGAGTVKSGADARAVLNTANEIGTYQAPAAEAVPIPVKFDAFQRLRRDSGALGAKAAEDASRGAESKVLYDFEKAMAARMDSAASGNALTGDFVPPEFAAKYGQTRDATAQFHRDYGQTNNIGAIVKKPAGQDYRLSGDQVFGKLWHGGTGLERDVSNLKNVLSQENYGPTMDAYRQAIMTDAASHVTAGGSLGAGLPRYVETRLPGLQEALSPEQLQSLTGVAKDIRNAAAANNVQGLTGSDTQAKISRALDAGLLDSPTIKWLSRVLTVKGVGGEMLRSKLASAVVENKGANMARLLADPAAAANALQGMQSGPFGNALQAGFGRLEQAVGAPNALLGGASFRDLSRAIPYRLPSLYNTN